MLNLISLSFLQLISLRWGVTYLILTIARTLHTDHTRLFHFHFWNTVGISDGVKRYSWYTQKRVKVPLQSNKYPLGYLPPRIVVLTYVNSTTGVSYYVRPLPIPFQWLLSWLLHKWREGALMATGTFSRNVGKLFSELKLVTDNLSLHPSHSQHWIMCQFWQWTRDLSFTFHVQVQHIMPEQSERFSEDFVFSHRETGREKWLISRALARPLADVLHHLANCSTFKFRQLLSWLPTSTAVCREGVSYCLFCTFGKLQHIEHQFGSLPKPCP